MRRLALAMLVCVLVAACGGGSHGESVVRMRACDDGGSGGVMIDGVCL